ASDALSIRRRGNGLSRTPDLPLHPVPLDEFPIRIEAEAGLVADLDVAVAQFGVLAEEAVGERVGLAPAMRLDAKGAARQRENEMAVDLRRGMGRHHHAMLLGERGDAQRLRKAGGAGRVELHIADAA